MSYSLQLAHGDFSVGGARLGVVSDAEKLLQDLRCCALERMGTDAAHPDYGSLIDGGRLIDGTLVAGLITSPNDASAASALQSELQRIVKSYQAQQVARAKNDRSSYNRVTLTSGEALVGITNVRLTQDQDRLIAVVTLQTATGEQVLQLAVGG